MRSYRARKSRYRNGSIAVTTRIRTTPSDSSRRSPEARFQGLEVSEAKRLRAWEAENVKLKRLLADAMLEGYLPQTLPVAHRVPVECRPGATTDSGRVLSI